MTRYGFQTLALLGSAGYQRAELPLDASVSLIADNNVGKTSLINALQFMLIIDQRRMDFGAHDLVAAKRFYFPNNSSYILLEVTLPQTGTVVFGCVGKGVSHDYEYFAYKGGLKINDYRLDNGTLVAQPQLFNHLAGQGKTAYRYDSKDFAKLIYGGNRNKSSSEPDFTVFKLEYSSDASVFQKVLTRTLRLDKLTSAEVKQYLLNIFKRDLDDASIDFKLEWDKAFHEVNAERTQYQAAINQLARIKKIEASYEERLILRGKLLDWRTRIDQGLAGWQQYHEDRTAELKQQENQLNELQQKQTLEDRELTKQMLELTAQQNHLEQTQTQYTTLAARFTLISDRSCFVQQIQDREAELDRLTAVLQQADGRSVQQISRAIEQQNKKAHELSQQLDSLNNNLYLHLHNELSASELERLNKVLSAQAMILSPDAYRLDLTTLQQTLAQTHETKLALAGLELNLETLSPQHQQRSEAELRDELADTQRELANLKQQLEAAQSLAKQHALKQQLKNDIQQLKHELNDYDRLQELSAQEPERLEELAAVRDQLDQIRYKLDNSQQHNEQLRIRLQTIMQQQNAQSSSHRIICELRDKRIDHSEPFQILKELPCKPWHGESNWPLDELAEKLKCYQDDCSRLKELNANLKTDLSLLHSSGLTRYQFAENEDLELKRIIDFSHQLPQEYEALEKKARSAVVNVSTSLRALRNSLLSLQSKMREFNRLIGQRQLSDLSVFKIEAEDETHLVEAINVLIDKSEQVNTGDSFELFNQASVLDDEALDRAKQILIDEGNARQGLKVADLFHLAFVVGKQNQEPELFADIDSAASNGTVLMAKLVTGLAMLYLMQDRRHKLHAICYLDEALALDSRNQANLIATAHDFGYALIFASPAPLTTVRYCVPIFQHNNANHISRDSWQIIEPLSDADSGT